MNTRQQTRRCRAISIPSATQARALQSISVLSLLGDQCAMNLAELAHCIRANSDLCHLVTEAASQEFGWPPPRVEDAIVLLGRKRLGTLLSLLIRRGRSAFQLHRTLDRYSITPSANLCLLEVLSEEPK